ncbi:MAG: hypothetical protein ACFCVG_00740 [Kineosporiaceae bacterium]
MFRCHDTMPATVTSPLYRRLIEEWIHLNDVAAVAHTLREWGQGEPVLTGCRRPADIVDKVDAAGPDSTDPFLLALIRLCQGGSQLAGRVLLQLMLPKLAAMAVRTRGTSADNAWSEDRRHIVVAEFWAVVTDYPVARRTRRVAANLALDTLHRVTADTRNRVHTVAYDDIEVLAVDPAPAPRAQAEVTSDDDLLHLLTWAVREGIVTADDGRLLAQVYVADQRDRAAAQRGLSDTALRQRCLRARKRLAEAVESGLGA